MYNIYANTKVNINDYPDVAGGHAVNQRIFEVMGCGGFINVMHQIWIVNFHPVYLQPIPVLMIV